MAQSYNDQVASQNVAIPQQSEGQPVQYQPQLAQQQYSQQPDAQQQQPYSQQPQEYYQQQPQQYGQPQTYAQPQTPGNAVTGFNTASINRVVTSIDGVLRIVEWLLSLIAFSVMANLTVASAFQFLVAANVIIWLWTMVMLVFYLLDLGGKNPKMHLVELIGDCVLVIFAFAASVATAVKCNSTLCLDPVLTTSFCELSVKFCTGTSQPQAADAFAFLTFFALCGSIFIDIKKWRDK